MKWRTIEPAPNYEVSEFGDVRNKKTGLVLKDAIDRYGYRKIGLQKPDFSKYYQTIHRLVALAYLSNDDPINKFQVNHKDADKLNNHISNLEWVTASENVIHSFDNLLNENTTPVLLIDHSTGEELTFRSIKSLGRHLRLFTSVLTPLILNSSENPIFGRYEVRIKNVLETFERSNTVNFGDNLFCYDKVTGEVTEYPSINLAAYFTCVRSLSNINKRSVEGVFNFLGYAFSKQKEKLNLKKSDTPDKILEERRKYVLVPSRRLPEFYVLYDYYSSKEYRFSNLSKIKKFLGLSEDNGQKAVVDYLRSKGRFLNGLILGYGIKNSQEYSQSKRWQPFNEEVILRSKNGGSKSPYKFYRVQLNNVEHLVQGTIALCELVGFPIPKNHYNLTIEEITDRLNNPNLRIERLNKPIVNVR